MRSRRPLSGPPARGDDAARRPVRAGPVTGTAPQRPAIDLAGHVVVAEFGRPHGVRGEIRLKSHTADPTAASGYGPLLGSDGRSFVLSDWRPAPGGEGDMFVVRVAGVADRTAAEALARLKLHVPRERLPALTDEDEFYLADLVGLAVEHAGERLGRVLAVHDFGAGDVLEIAPADAEHDRQASVMVPFTKAFVPTVDIAGGRLVVAADPFASIATAERE